MELRTLLDIQPGIIALIGGGGKTTMLYTLAAELAAEKLVVCCTTTHILPPPHMPVLDAQTPEELRKALEQNRCVCTGRPAKTGKLTAPTLPMEVLAALADYVLVEADGSAGRPFKAHAAHEPMLPRLANQVIYMVGASGFGRPVREAVHRPELFWFLSDLEPEDPVTPEAVAEALQIEAAAGGPPVRVFVNQAEDEAALANARRLAERLPWPVCAGALNRRSWTCLL